MIYQRGKVLNLRLSGNNIYRHVIIQQFYVLPTKCIYVFCVVLSTRAIISLYSMNSLVLITEI